MKAQQLAEQEHRSISELFREALRRYMGADTQWEDVLKRTRAIGAALGVQTEEDVERLKTMNTATTSGDDSRGCRY